VVRVRLDDDLFGSDRRRRVLDEIGLRDGFDRVAAWEL
tara:strand:+ start:477 stop:590 length:114 start_codon:yes stop_codon:yes gene_type:complete